MYRNLDPDKTIETIGRLQQRIQERFPNSGLGRVCVELNVVAKDIRQQAELIAQPNYGLRAAIVGTVLIGLFGLIYSFSLVDLSLYGVSLAEMVQVTEAGLNDLALLGAAIFFFGNHRNSYKTLKNFRRFARVAIVCTCH